MFCKVNKASSKVSTIGYPFKLKDVLSNIGTLVLS